MEKRDCPAEGLQGNDKCFREIFENSGLLAIVLDIHGRLSWCNPFFTELTGYTSEEINSYGVFGNILHGSNLSSGVEQSILAKSGKTLLVRWHYSTLTNSSGSVAGTCAVGQDITAQMQAEEELKKSELRHRLLFEHSMDAIAYHKILYEEGIAVDYEYISVNEAFGVLTGLHDVAGKRVSELVPGIHSGNPGLLERFARVMQTGKPEQYETYIVANNTWYFTSLYPLSDHTAVSVFKNITKTKLAESELIESEARLRNIFEQANDGIFIIDAGNHFLDANAQGLEMLGYSKDELLRMKLSDVLATHEHSRLSVEPPLVMSGIPQFAEWEHVCRDGSTFSGEVSAKRLNDSSYLAIVRNTKERRLAEKEIRNLNDRISTAASAARVGIWEWDITRNTLTWDDQMYRLYGREREGLEAGPYETWIRSLHPADREFSEEEVKAAFNGEREYDTEFRVIWQDGSVHFIKAAGKVFRNGNNNPERMVGINYDITENKLKEEEIRENSDFLKKMFKQGLIAKFLTRASDGVITEVNDQVENIFGYSRTEIIGKPTGEIQLLSDQGEESKLFELFTTLGFIRDQEVKIRRKSGETGTALMFASTITRNKEIYYFTEFLDITERKRAEEKVREKDIQFRKLSSHVPDLLFQFTRRTDGSYFVPVASEGIKNIFGCTPEAVLDDFGPIARVIHPDDAARVIAAIEYSAAHLSFFTCEFRVQLPGIGVRWIYSNSSPERLPDGSVTWYGFNANITERKLAELALLESENKLSLFIEHAPASLAMFDREMRYIAYSNRWLEDYKLAGRKLNGICHYDIFPEIGTGWHEVHQRAMNGEVICKEEDLFERADGTKQWLHWEVRPWYSEGVSVGGIVIFSENITERIETRDELHKLNAELENRVEQRTVQLKEANSELESFSYSISHDLRAPLRAINGFTRILQDEYHSVLDDEGRRICGIIHDNALKMGHLIDDLLAFSRYSRKEINLSRIDMETLVKSIYFEVTDEIQRAKIQFRMGNLAPCEGDPTLFRQVLINLLSNSVKFTSKTENPAVFVQSHYGGNGIIYTFKDNGAGFDMRYKDKLFGVFQRLHSAAEFDGTGVGLAIVHRIVSRHGGEVGAEGRVGKGATFWFSVPMNKNLKP